MPTPTELAHDAQKHVDKLRAEFDMREKELDKLNLQALRENLAVLQSRLDKLEKHIGESDRRRWQFVYIFAGAAATLLVTVLVQLVLLPLVKK